MEDYFIKKQTIIYIYVYMYGMVLEKATNYWKNEKQRYQSPMILQKDGIKKCKYHFRTLMPQNMEKNE